MNMNCLLIPSIPYGCVSVDFLQKVSWLYYYMYLFLLAPAAVVMMVNLCKWLTCPMCIHVGNLVMASYLSRSCFGCLHACQNETIETQKKLRIKICGVYF